jgi:hypothetical protein
VDHPAAEKLLDHLNAVELAKEGETRPEHIRGE